jgi:type IV pilus assembly protein PilC
MIKKSYFTKEELIIFSRQLALVMDSDVSLYEGLTLIKDKTPNEKLQNVIDKMLAGIKKGMSLSEVMEEQSESFSTFIVTMIKIGEQSGELANTLNQIAEAYEKELDTQSKVKAAITYPIILSVLMLGVILLLVIEVLPMFNDILMSLGGDMPQFTYIIMQTSLWIGRNLWAIIIVILALIGFGLFYRTTEKGRKLFDRLAFTMPIQRHIVSAITAIRFSRNLALLIRSGVNIGMGINLIKPIFENTYVKDQLDQAITRLNKGDMPDQVFEAMGLFPWVLIKLFTIAQSTGHMDTMLDKAAITMEKELDNHLDRLTTVIEPLLIIVLSVLVGVILISVILPIINIMNAIG